MSKSNYTVKSRIWIELNDEILMGEGRVRLLKAIDKHGSLSKAAKSLGMSYKKAWSLIDTMNNRGEELLTVNKVGGSSGGGTTITAYGRRMIEMFDAINSGCWDYLDREMAGTLKQLNLKSK